MSGIAVLAGTLMTALATVVCVVIAARAARRAAADQREAQRMAAEPAQRSVDLSILKETADRLDRENDAIRTELTGLRALVRAYSWTVDRLIRHMDRAGVPADPEDVHDLVREHMRTGS